MVHILRITELDRVAHLRAHEQLPPLAQNQCAAHRCDAHVVAESDGMIVARCSLWWTEAPQLSGERVGVIGHFAGLEPSASVEILDQACAELTTRGCTIAVGPMDGNTWRRYRFITERDTEPSFFLEPDNPDVWPQWFERCGFTPLATYFSALNNDLSVEDPRLVRAAERLEREGIHIRPLRLDDFDEELRRIYGVSIASFQNNFLYTPITEGEFIAQYEPVRSRIRPELVLLAEAAGETVGFVFALPDMAQAQRGRDIDTVVLKTVAVRPGRRAAGLGGILVGRCQQHARALGYRRVIHALMHESNNARNLSAHYAKPVRRYTLFGRRLR